MQMLRRKSKIPWVLHPSTCKQKFHAEVRSEAEETESFSAPSAPLRPLREIKPKPIFYDQKKNYNQQLFTLPYCSSVRTGKNRFAD